MASKYAGYMGKVMLVDLSTETVTEYPGRMSSGSNILAARSWPPEFCATI